MKKLALLLSLLALGALGLTACGGSDDETTAVSEATAASEAEAAGDELAADQKPCGIYGRYGLAVIGGDISCRVVRRVIHDYAYQRLPGSWRCSGPDGNVECTKEPWAPSRTVITARFSREPTTVDADPGNNNRLSNEERIEQAGDDFAALFAEGGFKPGLWRYMGQPAGGRMNCKRIGGPIKNCTPPSTEYRQSFADATVERVVIDGHHATAEFSNGESVEFDGQKADEGDKAVAHSAWWIPEEWVKEIARRNFEA